MNCRLDTTTRQRTRWWRNTGLLATGVALAGLVNAQVGPNYNFTQTSGTYTPITGGTLLVTQTSTTTSDANALDDGTTYTVSIPFTFIFDGVGYTSCTVTNNGSISFGGTPITATTYGSISGTGAYAGAIAAYARDLQGGYVFSANRTLGSNILTMGTGGSTAGVTVGSTISGTGIPVGTTVTAFDATTVTMSAAATSTGTNTAAWVWNGEMRHQTLGSPGSQILVIQWSNMKPFGVTLTTVNSFRMNWQVRLYEADNSIEIVYGACSPGANTSTTTAQVGLRGPNNTFPANVNNRLVTKGVNDWATSLPGIANTSGLVFNNNAPANVITSGLTYRWFDPPCDAPSANVTVSPLNCATGQYTATVNVTGLGDAPNVDIISSLHGLIADNVGTGSYASTANPLGTPESFTVVHNGNALCNISLGPVVRVDGDNTCHSAATFPIPDNGCALSNFLDLPFCVSDPGTALGTDVYVQSVDLIIAHTWNDDLDIQLINPNGTVVNLVNDRFGSGDNFGDPALCPGGLFTLAAGGTALSNTATSNVVGTYTPEQPLTTLHDGSNPNGQWTLRVCDDTGSDVGNVRFVRVNLIPCLPPTATSSSTTSCSTNTYTASVNVTGLGTSASVNIVSSVHGTLFTGVGIGAYSSNPTAFGTPETITVVASNPACNLTYNFNIDDNDNVCHLAATFPIPDAGCALSNFLNLPFCVSDPGTALGTDVFVQSVDLIIAHTWNDDLDIQLINPNGTVVNLVNDRFGSGDNFGNPALCPGGLFTLQAGGTALNNTATSNVVGTYAPEQPLSTLHDGSNPNGQWTLRVCDDTGSDVGNVRFVRVNLVPCEAPVAGGQTIVPACGTNSFFIDVNITSLGSSATIDLSNSFDANVVTANATGVWQVGPFPSGSTVTVTLEANNALCDVSLAPQTFLCPPPNDACANAIPINCNSIVPGTTVGATVEAPVPPVCGTTYTAPGVWYTVVGTGGPMTASTCVGASYDTKLNVFSGSCGALVCVGGNDDFAGCGLLSRVNWSSTLGTTYYILVQGFGSATGTFSLEVVCGGQNVPPCANNGVQLQLRTDDFGGETRYEITPFGNTIPVCSSAFSSYPNNALVNVDCCLIDGCYLLTVFDQFGDGMSLSTPAGEGGFRLVTAGGSRIIDAWKDGDGFTSTSSVALPFCLPIGGDQLTFAACDRENWVVSEFIVATPNAAVSAQWGIGDQTDDGYQFWFYNPHGGYSRRVFRNHATSGGFGPPGPTRACHLQLSSIVTNPIPYDALLNVRIRSRVNGVYSEFGPACRFLMPTTLPSCPTTKLIDNPASPNYSCGVTRTFGFADKIYCYPVTYPSTANRYRWRFERDGGGFTRVITSPTAGLVLAWATAPLVVGDTYNVQVQASFDNGATYCAYGDVCQVTIVAPPTASSREVEATTTATGLRMYPNPNNGQQLVLSIAEVNEELVAIEVHDLFGRLVVSTTKAAQGGSFFTTLSLDQLASGVYHVNVIAGDQRYTERLVINK